MEEFRKLGISGPMLRVIEEEHFKEPSEIQIKAIPLILEGKDVIAKSATGSGKTLVFGALIVKECIKGKGIQSLILTPTRELAEQVCNALRRFSKYTKLEVNSIYGGVGIEPQIQKLRISDVVIGTPGRLLDHLERKTIDLSNVKILVLDEADRMLDMGFIDDVEKIVRRCNKQRQTLFFSATIPQDVARLSHKYMKNPVQVSAESYVDPTKLTQVYYNLPEKNKVSLLVHLLKKEQRLVMVFCNTKITTDFVAYNLKKAGIDAQAIHGGFSQNKRSRTMEHFNSMKVNVLVCTDVAARGLDIKGISHVYNYDIPRESKQYIHRIGRTARAGKEGKAVSLLSEKDYDSFAAIQRDFSVEIKREQVPEFELLNIRRHTGGGRDSRGHRDSRRHYSGRTGYSGERRTGYSGSKSNTGPRRHSSSRDSRSDRDSRREGYSGSRRPRRQFQQNKFKYKRR
ncbi:MAG: DEAD/DEAH box helicase [Nanoarchaeota archaeon]|nr:DEAD/DEAH box helicase [Nanoarchaeota archaeon]